MQPLLVLHPPSSNPRCCWSLEAPGMPPSQLVVAGCLSALGLLVFALHSKRCLVVWPGELVRAEVLDCGVYPGDVRFQHFAIVRLSQNGSNSMSRVCLDELACIPFCSWVKVYYIILYIYKLSLDTNIYNPLHVCLLQNKYTRVLNISTVERKIICHPHHVKANLTCVPVHTPSMLLHLPRPRSGSRKVPTMPLEWIQSQRWIIYSFFDITVRG